MAERTYKAATLLDISRIPEEALPRFMKELPEMLGMLREVDKFHKASVSQESDQDVAAEAIAKSEAHLLNHILWVDDGGTDIEFSMTGKDDEGEEILKMHADSKTRDFAAIHNGEDRTYDILLVGRLNRAVMFMTTDDIEMMMPEGALILPLERLNHINDMTPEAVNELCLSANRSLFVKGDENAVPEAWKKVARIIASNGDATDDRRD